MLRSTSRGTEHSQGQCVYVLRGLSERLQTRQAGRQAGSKEPLISINLPRVSQIQWIAPGLISGTNLSVRFKQAGLGFPLTCCFPVGGKDERDASISNRNSAERNRGRERKGI